MECPQIDLYEFLAESELQQYYNAIKNELKITNATQFKYASDEDLKNIGLSRPEIRRLRKFYEKHFPHGYLSKIKRLLQTPATIVKREDGNSTLSLASLSHGSSGGGGGVGGGDAAGANNASGVAGSPNKAPNNKHIIPADSISVNKQLGTGEFGIVQQGVWTNGTERIQVAIKCLCRDRMQSNPMEFLKEAAIMHSIEHENIVRLYGVVLATDSLMLVTELAHLRSLLECLKDSGLRTSFLTIPTLCEFALQICNGMHYLENKRLIHRDLAARNILVFSKSKVKISDFGLSRALGVGKDYYKTNFNVNLKLPIAWCAPECINYLRFTNASDVWAYGVCLWEMFSYGFQPWAALTGLQILEAIDAPNYQRLEQPDCCPRDYYTLMMKCWQDDPAKRPKFSEICEMLPDMKPEQLKAVANCLETKKDHLIYRQGDIITVLERNTGSPFWKGVLTTGKVGFFNPSNTVAFLEGLPSSNRDSFCRVNERNGSTKRKLRTEMISKPQNDFKHTGHVGIDGASFGDIAFLGNSQNYNHVPRQIVTPYKPSEDIEQTPLLLPPTPTSPDSLQTASGYFPESGSLTRGMTSLNPTFVPSTENTPKHFGQAAFDFPTGVGGGSTCTNPFTKQQLDEAAIFAMQNNNYGMESEKNFHKSNLPWTRSLNDGAGANSDDPHEYHEISDDEITADKLDFGPSLLDEINSMFGSMSAGSSSQQPKSPDFEQTNLKNELVETSTTKKERKVPTALSGSAAVSTGNAGDSNGNNKFSVSLTRKKTAGTVKQISVKDEKILNQAIDFANEISARSMIDLVTDQPPNTQSPKRKFSFRFPHLNSNTGGGNGSGSHDKSSKHAGKDDLSGNATHLGLTSPHSKKKNFTEELRSIPDLQSIIGEEGREAYNSLIERKTNVAGNLSHVVSAGLSPAVELLRQLHPHDLEMSRTLPRRSMHGHNNEVELNLNVNLNPNPNNSRETNSNDLVTPPAQNAPRPMTLPTRGAANRMRNRVLELNGRGTTTGQQQQQQQRLSIDDNCNQKSPTSPSCESPSYLVNTHSTFYKFPSVVVAPAAATKEGNGNGIGTETLSMQKDDPNPVPLPPRDGKKHIKTNAKRHVRKYPLIIPANGVQRTLNKVTEKTTNDDGELDGLEKWPTSNHNKNENEKENLKSNGKNNLNTVNNLQVVATVRPTSLTTNLAANSSTTPVEQNGGGLTAIYQNGVIAQKFKEAKAASKAEHDYQNLDSSGKSVETSETDDTASLQFESILEANFDQQLVLQSPDVTDGFPYNFSLQKENYNKSKAADYEQPEQISGLYVNEDELRNLDIDRSLVKLQMPPSKTTTSAITTTTTSGKGKGNFIELMMTENKNKNVKDSSAMPVSKSTHQTAADNELAGNILFKKVRQSIDQAMSPAAIQASSTASAALDDLKPQKSMATKMTTSTSTLATKQQRQQTEAEYFAATAARLADSNSVSCEDLLEFADQKPKGRERGVDSDEVNIMMKVLGAQCNTARCLASLDFIDWDVHKAIKLIKLQNILPTCELSFSDAGEALKQCEWDLHLTAMKLRGLKT